MEGMEAAVILIVIVAAREAVLVAETADDAATVTVLADIYIYNTHQQ